MPFRERVRARTKLNLGKPTIAGRDFRQPPLDPLKCKEQIAGLVFRPFYLRRSLDSIQCVTRVPCPFSKSLHTPLLYYPLTFVIISIVLSVFSVSLSLYLSSVLAALLDSVSAGECLEVLSYMTIFIYAQLSHYTN